ncbi:hypothetical protein UlMin_045609 [Ulmus minor]
MIRRRDRANKNTQVLDMEIAIPTHFRCPISLDLMRDPVTLSTGITYDRQSIERWIEQEGNQTCPVTNQILNTFDQIPNHAIRRMIQDWCVQNRSSGIERIPTPRIPVSAFEVSAICDRIWTATKRGDRKMCGQLVGKMKIWAKESDRNRRCISNNGAGLVLAASFEAFSKLYMEENRALLEEILSLLTWVFPLGFEGQAKIGSHDSLTSIVSFLGGNDLSSRQNAVLVIKELVSLDQSHVVSLAKIDGAIEGLVRVISEPVSPKATKASLTAIFHMVHSCSESKIRSRFVEMGLVPLLLEIVVDGEKGVCERAFGVLDGLCDCEKGRKMAYENDLMIPILVKKMLRVSDLGTELLISMLWKLCKKENRKENDVVLVEALQVGAFHKLLVVLQMSPSERVKGKATELLKLFNLHRSRLDCVDYLDFKHLKRPF